MNSHQPDGAPAVSELKGLRDDVYRRPLVTALHRLGLGPGWRCLEVGAGSGSVARWLAAKVGPEGSVLATDIDTRWVDTGGLPQVFHVCPAICSTSAGGNPGPR